MRILLKRQDKCAVYNLDSVTNIHKYNGCTTDDRKFYIIIRCLDYGNVTFAEYETKEMRDNAFEKLLQDIRLCNKSTNMFDSEVVIVEID